jgi:hypothetical protein
VESQIAASRSANCFATDDFPVPESPQTAITVGGATSASRRSDHRK